jgi:AraC family transcriptional activator of tynA and feaB
LKTIFSTTDVHARERFDYWHDVACKNIVEHDSNPECRQTFQAELQSEGLADLGLVLFENSPMTVSHTARHMAHASTDELFVCRQIAGVLALEQDNREVVLESGDFTLLDPRVPYAGKFAEGSRLLVLKFPRRLLEARVGKTQIMTARCMKPSEAENSLTSAFLAMLPRHTGRLGQAAEEIAKDQVLDLVAVSLAKGMEGSGPRISSARSLALVRLRAAIESRLTDPALDARTVAAAAGVSVRYANAVLAEESTSIMRLIQARRLARCRKALEDPLQIHRTVSEIAYSWGFLDMTHFGRKFRATYGLLPSEYRRSRRAT